jgi:serine/threonine kinase PknH
MSDEGPQFVGVGSQFGPYRLKRLLGRGGMGQVFEAENRVMDRVVALKLMSAQYSEDPEFKKRLQREARIAGRLQEPHVVPIHDAGEINGQLYVDMRLIDGTDLQTVLKSSGPMAPARAVAIVRQIASALDAAHAAGVIHRDVKPANILLTSEDFAYLVDFGIANAVTEERLTHIGDVLGTWTYMAPERFVGDSDTISHSVDTYALACVLYEMLTGSPPYQGDRVHVMGGHLTKPIPLASTLRAGIPEALDDVISRGMAKNPDDRYPSAGELARAAAAAVAGAGGYDETAPTTISGPHARATDVIRGSALPPGQPPEPPKTGSLAAAARRHWKPLAAVIVVILAAAAAGIWAVTRSGPVLPPAGPSTSTMNPTPTPTATPTSAAASEFTPADVNLLKIMPGAYSRANCRHNNPGFGADAMIVCLKNSVTADPPAMFYHYAKADDLARGYQLIRETFHATSCPGDPPGPDAPWSVPSYHDGKPGGRRACYTDPTLNPPAPAYVMTNPDNGVVAQFFYPDAGGLDLRNWDAAHGGLVDDPPGRDPDFFTPADLDLFKKLGNTTYTQANCRHIDPPSPYKAALGCGPDVPDGAPSAQAFSIENREMALTIWDSQVKLLGLHRCGAAPGAGTDDPWISHDGRHIGRYACFTEGPEFQNVPALLASASEFGFLGIEFLADLPDSPYAIPKTEQALADWFTNKFSA